MVTGAKPKAVLQVEGGRVRAAIWQGKYTYNYTFNCCYKDKAGKWRNDAPFNKADLLVLRHLIEACLSLNLDSIGGENEQGSIG